MGNNELMVAVWMLTYNHEKYLSQAIDSIINQKTNFRYRLFIGEDYSKDTTRDICISYKNKYPDLIELILARENNIELNAINTSKACAQSGCSYIAFCEGDDYWIDENKLQKQVAYMQAHPECSMSFHDVLIVDEVNNVTVEYRFNKNFDLGFNYLPGKIAGQTSSLMIKNFFNELGDDWEEKYELSHSNFHSLSLMFGEIQHIDGIMSVYRQTSSGTWTKKSDIEKYKTINKGLRKNLKIFDSRFYNGFTDTIIKNEYKMSFIYLKEKNILYFIKYQYLSIIHTCKYFGIKSGFNLLRHSIKKLLKK